VAGKSLFRFGSGESNNVSPLMPGFLGFKHGRCRSVFSILVIGSISLFSAVHVNPLFLTAARDIVCVDFTRHCGGERSSRYGRVPCDQSLISDLSALLPIGGPVEPG
jgi:hypothetical protein